jgi:hypothetical protein
VLTCGHHDAIGSRGHLLGVRTAAGGPTVQAPTRPARPAKGPTMRILLIILVILAIIYVAQLVLKKR